MSDKFWHQRSYCGNTLWNAISDRLKIERRNLIKMKQENTRKREKMIMVEKSTKWWMTVVASGSLAVGLLGGLGIGSLATNALNQQAIVQTSTSTQAQNRRQPGHQVRGGPGMPPGGQQNGNNQGGPNGMPPQQNGNQSDNSNSQNGSGNSNNSKKKAPSNADGSTKSDKNSSTTENNDSNTTNS